MSKRGLRDLAKHSSVYAVGNFLRRAIGFVLIPLYTRLLSPADYGILEILNVSLEIILIFCHFGVGMGMMRSLLYEVDTKEEQRTAFATAFWFVVAASIVVLSVASLLSAWIAKVATGNPSLSGWFRLVFAAGFLQINASIILRVYRAELRSLAFTAIQLSTFAIGLGLNIYFLVALHTGVRGILLSEVISSAFLLATSAFFLRDFFSLAFSWSMFRSMLRFGAPFVPSFMAMWILTGADRYFLQHFASSSEVGLYSLGMRFALILQFIFRTPFEQTWGAIYYPLAKQPGGNRELGRIAAYVFAAGIFLALGIGLLAGPAIRVMAAPSFHPSQRVVPLLLAAVLFHTLNLCVSVGINVSGKSEYTTVVALLSAGTNLLLNWLWVPRYGMMGAASATAVSFATMVLAHYVISQRLYRIEFDWQRIGKAVLALVIIVLARGAIPALALPWEFLIASLLTALYPALLVAMGFLGAEERRWLRQAVQQSASKLSLATGHRP